MAQDALRLVVTWCVSGCDHLFDLGSHVFVLVVGVAVAPVAGREILRLEQGVVQA